MIKYVAYFALPVHVTLLIVFAIRGVTELAFFDVWRLAMWLGVRRANARGWSRLASVLLDVEVSAHAVAAVSLLGLGSGFQYYLIPIIALTLFHDQLKPRTAITGSASVVVLFVAMHYAFADTVVHPGRVRSRGDAGVDRRGLSYFAEGMLCLPPSPPLLPKPGSCRLRSQGAAGRHGRSSETVVIGITNVVSGISGPKFSGSACP